MKKDDAITVNSMPFARNQHLFQLAERAAEIELQSRGILRPDVEDYPDGAEYIQAESDYCKELNKIYLAYLRNNRNPEGTEKNKGKNKAWEPYRD